MFQRGPRRVRGRTAPGGTARGPSGGGGALARGPVAWASSRGSGPSSARGPTARGARTSWEETWSHASATSSPAEVSPLANGSAHWPMGQPTGQRVGPLVNVCVCSPPVDGGWSRWSPWSRCDRRCGGGRSIRTRSCSSPPSKNGGKTCEGEKNQVKACNTKPCGERTHTHTETHTQRHTETHTQRHPQRHTHRDTHTETHTHRDTHTETHTQRHPHRDTHTETPTETHPQRHTHRDTHTETPTETHTQRHPQRHTHRDTHTETHTHTHTHRHTRVRFRVSSPW